MHFQIPSVFHFFPPFRPQIFPVPINVICDYHIDITDLADLASIFFWQFSRKILKYLLPLESQNLQLEQTPLRFDKIFQLQGRIDFGKGGIQVTVKY